MHSCSSEEPLIIMQCIAESNPCEAAYHMRAFCTFERNMVDGEPAPGVAWAHHMAAVVPRRNGFCPQAFRSHEIAWT